jgi:hypothetical protein
VTSVRKDFGGNPGIGLILRWMEVVTEKGFFRCAAEKYRSVPVRFAAI